MGRKRSHAAEESLARPTTFAASTASPLAAGLFLSLDGALAALATTLGALAAPGGKAHRAERVHRVRVLARRVEVLVCWLEPALDARFAEKTLAHASRARKRASSAREARVVAEALARLAPDSTPALRARERAERAEREYARDRAPRAARRLAADHGALEASLAPFARGDEIVDAGWQRLVGEARSAAVADARAPRSLHDLRIATKRLRYAIEATPEARRAPSLAKLHALATKLQDTLGAHRDAVVLAGMVGDPELGVLPRVVARVLAARDAAEARVEKLVAANALAPALAAADRAFATRVVAPSAPPSAAREDVPERRRVAAIDVGSNSIRLIVAEDAGDGAYRVLDDEKETARLGVGLASEGAMRSDAIVRAASVIAHMATIARGYRVDVLRIVGTAVLRDASNRDELVERVRRSAGVALEVISAEEEARLAFASVEHHFDLAAQDAVIADIGGGSLEMVFVAAGRVDRVVSLPLGAVRLTEKMGGPVAVCTCRRDELVAHADKVLRRGVGRVPFAPQVLYGTGGTMTALANVALLQRGDARPKVGGSLRGLELLRSDVRHARDWLRDLDARERARVPGLSPSRSEIIVAGVSVVERAMKVLGVNRLRVHDGGIREGLVLGLLPESSRARAKDAPADVVAVARKFGEDCGYEARHCQHVAHLATRLFDAVAALPAHRFEAWTSPSNRALLHAAALLKDVGYRINYSQHHHHSYHLISHADLRGLRAREIEIVANLARYHRRAEPKLEHESFAKLDAADRDLVSRLASFLRVADGLDRTHVGTVHDLALAVVGSRFELSLDAEVDPEAEMWGARRKLALFEKVFGKKVDLVWRVVAPASGQPASNASPASLPRRAASASV